MRRLDAREQRLAAVALLIVAIALVWLALVMPIARGFSARAERRDELVATYARDDRIIGQVASLRRLAAKQRGDEAQYRMATADPAAATAMLSERLGADVAAVGGELNTVEDIGGPPGTVRARVECRLTLRQVAALLERLQETIPLLAVDALAIGAGDSPQSPRPDLLDVRIEVSAFYSSPTAR